MEKSEPVKRSISERRETCIGPCRMYPSHYRTYSCVVACPCVCTRLLQSPGQRGVWAAQGDLGKLLTHGVNSCSRRRQCFVKRGTPAGRGDVSEASQCLRCLRAAGAKQMLDATQAERGEIKVKRGVWRETDVPGSGRYAVE